MLSRLFIHQLLQVENEEKHKGFGISGPGSIGKMNYDR